MKIKKLAILIFFFCLALAMQAEQLLVLYVNSDSIKVDGKILKTGMTIDSRSRIQWAKSGANQIVKVSGKKSHKVYILSSHTMTMNNHTTIEQSILQKKALASRSAALTNMQAISSFFNRRIAMLHGMNVEVASLLDDEHFFFLQYDREGEEMNKRIPSNGRCLIFNDDIFMIDGEMQPAVTRSYRMYYYDMSNGLTTLVSDSLTIDVSLREEASAFLASIPHGELKHDDVAELLTDYLHTRFPAVALVEEDVQNAVCIP